MATADVTTIRARMARIRSRAQGKAVRLTRETKQLFNWKYYVRMAPWGVLGAAVLAGYLLVPARRTPSGTVPESLPAPTPLPVAAPPPERRPGLFGTVVRFAVNTAVRSAIAYAGQAVGNYVAQFQHSLASHPHAADKERSYDTSAS